MNGQDTLVNETLVQMKYARIIGLLAERLQISQPKALELFYNSETYTNLNNRANHLHNMSDAFLADEVMLELEKKRNNDEEKRKDYTTE